MQKPPAGWYRDPSGPGMRWWDGHAWGTQTSPDGQTNQPKRRSSQMKLLLIGGGILLTVVVVAIVAAVAISSGSDDRANSDETSGASPGSLHENWIPAVCAPGSDTDGAGAYLANATNVGHCIAQSDPSRRIFIGIYDAFAHALEDLRVLGPAAFIENTDGTYTVFAMDPNSGLPFLEPLNEYGFSFCARNGSC